MIPKSNNKISLPTYHTACSGLLSCPNPLFLAILHFPALQQDLIFFRT